MNIATAMQELEGNNVVSVYLKQEVPTLKAAQIGQEIQKLDNVETCEFIPKDEAIQQYMDLLLSLIHIWPCKNFLCQRPVR